MKGLEFGKTGEFYLQAKHSTAIPLDVESYSTARAPPPPHSVRITHKISETNIMN